MFSHQREWDPCVCVWVDGVSDGWGMDGALVTAVFWGSSIEQMCESRADVEDSACVITKGDVISVGLDFEHLYSCALLKKLQHFPEITHFSLVNY